MATVMSSALVNGDEKTTLLPAAHGLTILTTAVFAVGEMAGTGVLALPAAMVSTGVTGIVLNVLCAFVSAYTGVLLGKCWLMAMERYTEYREQVRDPYPIIGEIAMGKTGRILVSISINFTLFGVATVFLLLSSENIQALVKDAGKDISFCYWLLIVAGILCPLSWLGTPKDFWPIAVGAVIATSIACVIILANIIKDKVDQEIPTFQPDLKFEKFFSAFGVICFAYGGHPAFPTFQADMKKPGDFGKAISLAYFIVLLMYLPVAVAGYYAYGINAHDNILTSISSGPMLTTVTVLITMHLVCGFVIVVNPVLQHFEMMLGLPAHFTIRRVFFRTFAVGFILFVAESIPHFGAILALVGGSSTTLLAYVFPPVFFLRMAYMKGEWETKEVPAYVKIACAMIVVLGVLGGISATYSAIVSLITGSFSTPCYVNMRTAA